MSLTPVRLGPEFVVNTTLGSDQFSPSIAALADGRFVVSWSDSSLSSGDTSHTAVRARVFNTNGTQAVAEFLVNTTTTSYQQDARVSALEGGGFVVTWTDYNAGGGDTSPTAVRGQVYSPTGAKLGSEFLVNTITTSSQIQPAVTTLADGRFVVTWTDHSASSDDPAGSAVRGQVFTASGAKSGREFLVNTTTPSGQFDPSVTALENGGFVVSWTDTAGDGSSYAVRAQVFTSTGTKSGGEIAVNTTTTSSQELSSLVALADGGFVVTWMDFSATGGDTSNTAIRGQVFSDTGTKFGREFLVNSTVADSQFSPEVASLSDGRFVVTWIDSSQTGDDTSGYAVRAQVFSATGQKHGSEFLVNTTTASTQTNPTVTELVDGRLVFAWTDYSATGGDPSGSAVRGQIFDPRIAAVDLTGTTLGDQYVGTGWGDRIAGFWGNDRLYGRGGDDKLWGDKGNDALQGEAGRDLLYGGVGNDSLVGQGGEDQIYGGSGNDQLSGGYDADLLSGGSGLNTLTGGAGADLFVFDTAREAASLADRIQSFVRGVDDIGLDPAFFAGLGAEGPLAAGRFRVGAALDADDRILYRVTETGDARVGTLSYDPDGNGAAAAVAFALLTGGPSITAADVLVL